MAEYINRKILVDLVLSKLKFMGDARIMNQNDEKVLSEIDGYEKAMEAVHELILDRDLIENVQPVKRGRWIDCTFYDSYEKSYEQNFEYKCSCCGHMIYNKPNNDNLFCGHCGARMDGEDNE